jgi:hypothetical protein
MDEDIEEQFRAAVLALRHKERRSPEWYEAYLKLFRWIGVSIHGPDDELDLAIDCRQVFEDELGTLMLPVGDASFNIRWGLPRPRVNPEIRPCPESRRIRRELYRKTILELEREKQRKASRSRRWKPVPKNT